MAGTKIVTRKLTSWHGRDEEFSNVYYFGDGGLGLSPSVAEAEALIDAIIAEEKKITHSVVRFLGGAAYHMGANDGPGDTDAIATRELSASGNQGGFTTATFCNPELAIDLKFLLGGRRYLRTMFHACTLHGYDASAVSATPTANISPLVKTFADKMLNGPWPGGYQRIAPNGDRATVVQYNPFIEHRQFHRYRRRPAGLLG